MQSMVPWYFLFLAFLKWKYKSNPLWSHVTEFSTFIHVCIHHHSQTWNSSTNPSSPCLVHTAVPVFMLILIKRMVKQNCESWMEQKFNKYHKESEMEKSRTDKVLEEVQACLEGHRSSGTGREGSRTGTYSFIRPRRLSVSGVPG